MPRRKKRYRECQRKQPHATRSDALRHLVALYKQKPWLPHNYQPYRCKHCGQWHIGRRKASTMAKWGGE